MLFDTVQGDRVPTLGAYRDYGSPPAGTASEAAGRAAWHGQWRGPSSAAQVEARRAPANKPGTAPPDPRIAPPPPANQQQQQQAQQPGGAAEDALQMILRLSSGGDGSDLLSAANDSTGCELLRFGGARGAEKFAGERARFEREPWEAPLSLDAAGREACGVRAGQPHRLEDAVMQLPFGTHLSKKRAGFLFGLIGEALLQGDSRLAGGICAQAIRWLSLSLTLGQEEDAWRVTFVNDPSNIECPKAQNRPDLLSCNLQDIRQLTSLVGIIKDEESVKLRLMKSSPGGGGQKANDEQKEEGAGRKRRGKR